MPCVPRDLLLSPYDRLGASIFIHRIAVRKSEIHALTTNIAANLNYLFDYFGSIIVMLGSADFFTVNVVMNISNTITTQHVKKGDKNSKIKRNS